jgi:hypothetical protein
LADNLSTQDTDLATLPTATGIAAVEGAFSGQTVYAGLGILGKTTGAEGSRVFTTVDPATEGGQTTGNASLASIDGKTPALSGGAVPVTGPLTDTQLRASAVPVSLASAPLPSGAATAANQVTEIAGLASIDTNTAPLIAAGGGGYVRQDSTATIAKEAGGNLAATATSVASIDTKTPALVGGAVPVTGPLTDTQLRATPVPVTATTIPTKAATATKSNVSANASNVTVLASNASRKGGMFYNDSASACYLSLGATASVTSFTKKLLPGDYFDITPLNYTGIVDCIWDSAVGSMRVTELT